MGPGGDGGPRVRDLGRGRRRSFRYTGADGDGTGREERNGVSWSMLMDGAGRLSSRWAHFF